MPFVNVTAYICPDLIAAPEGRRIFAELSVSDDGARVSPGLRVTVSAVAVNESFEIATYPQVILCALISLL